MKKRKNNGAQISWHIIQINNSCMTWEQNLAWEKSIEGWRKTINNEKVSKIEWRAKSIVDVEKMGRKAEENHATASSHSYFVAEEETKACFGWQTDDVTETNDWEGKKYVQKLF